MAEKPASREEAWEIFQDVAADVLQKPKELIEPEASFTEVLDADSLDLVELVMGLEEKFDIKIDESELEGVTTVGHAFELLCSKLGL